MNNLGDVLAKVRDNVFIRRRRILDHIVKESGQYRVHIGSIARLDHEIKNFDQMI